MRKVVYLSSLFAFFVMLCSCRHEDNIPEPQPAIYTYTDIEPDTLLRSIDSLIWWGTYYIPAPTTSNDTIALDVDRDGDNDIAISIGTYYAWESNTYPENNNHTEGACFALDNTISVLRAPMSPYLELADNSQVISVSNASWVASAKYMSDPQFGPTITFTGDKYFVFRQTHPLYGSRYGWIHVRKPDDYNVFICEIGMRDNYELTTIVVGQH